MPSAMRSWMAPASPTTHPVGRFRNLYPTYRLRLVAPLKQLFFDLRPARFKDARQLFDGEAVDAGRSLVAHHRIQCCFYVVWVTDRLHEMICGCQAVARI